MACAWLPASYSTYPASGPTDPAADLMYLVVDPTGLMVAGPKYLLLDPTDLRVSDSKCLLLDPMDLRVSDSK